MSRIASWNSTPSAWDGLFRRSLANRWPRMRRGSAWAAIALSSSVFAFDCFLPVSGTITMLYVLPAALALGTRRQDVLVRTALLCVAFTMIGFFIGESTMLRSDDLVQRGCALIALGLVSWIGWQLVASVETAEQLRVDSCLRQVAEEAATFFRSMVDHVPIGVSRTDLNGRFVFVNEAFSELMGVPVDDLLGRSASDFEHSTFAQNLSAEEQQVVQSGQSMERIERLIRDDGNQYLQVLRTPVRDAHRQVVGIQTMWLNVSELKQAQHGLERYAEKLERSNVDLQQFAYVASHDLQEPLRAVSSYCQLLEKQYAGQLDERALRWLHFVVSGAQRMQTLVQDLLTYARIDNRVGSWIAVDSGAACRQAVENLSQVIDESLAQITIGELPIVWANTTQLEIVFQNLIGNAVKFRGDATPRILVTAEPAETEWQFAVRDNGIGIKPEFHDKVFEIFKRLQPRDRYPGTGIGLAICKRIVERYGGRIWIDSQPGIGSTFFFTLPHPPAPSETDHATS